MSDPPADGAHCYELTPTEVAALREAHGNVDVTVAVIRQVRERTHWHLREAKLLVDTFLRYGCGVTYAEMRASRVETVHLVLVSVVAGLAEIQPYLKKGAVTDAVADRLEGMADVLELQVRELRAAEDEVRAEAENRSVPGVRPEGSGDSRV